MNKKNESNNIVWPIVLSILFIALIAGFIFFFFSKNLQSLLPENLKNSLALNEKATQDILFNGKPQPGAVLKPADKIILKTVNFDSTGKISEIFMFVPANMVDGTISIDGKQIDSQLNQQDNASVIEFTIPEEIRQNELTFLVLKNGSQLGTCSLIKNESLTLSGDCIF
jgi:hypothetical protein